MKSSQVTKLYSKLSPQELANLAVYAAIRRDKSEIDAIMGQVEWNLYKCPHAEFRRRSMGLFILSGYYGTEYWKNRALMMIAIHCGDKHKESFDYALKFADKLKAMDAALAETCKQANVEIDAVKKMAGCFEFGHDFGGPLDDKLVEEYGDIFKIALES